MHAQVARISRKEFQVFKLRQNNVLKVKTDSGWANGSIDGDLFRFYSFYKDLWSHLVVKLKDMHTKQKIETRKWVRFKHEVVAFRAKERSSEQKRRKVLAFMDLMKTGRVDVTLSNAYKNRD